MKKITLTIIFLLALLMFPVFLSRAEDNDIFSTSDSVLGNFASGIGKPNNVAISSLYEWQVVSDDSPLAGSDPYIDMGNTYTIDNQYDFDSTIVLYVDVDCVPGPRTVDVFTYLETPNEDTISGDKEYGWVVQGTVNDQKRFDLPLGFEYMQYVGVTWHIDILVRDSSTYKLYDQKKVFFTIGPILKEHFTCKDPDNPDATKTTTFYDTDYIACEYTRWDTHNLWITYDVKFKFYGPMGEYWTSNPVDLRPGYYTRYAWGGIYIKDYPPEDNPGAWYVDILLEDKFRVRDHFDILSTKRTLIIEVSGTGTTNPSPGTHTYNYGSSVPVAAMETDSRWRFDHWELDDVSVGSANPYNVYMDTNHRLKAVFKLVQRSVTFYTNPIVGSIDFSGATYTHGQTGSYADGSYSAKANPPTDYVFHHWEYGGGVYIPNININPTTVDVSGDGWLKAVFAAKVTFYTNPSDKGSIRWGSTAPPDYINGQSIHDPNLPPDYGNIIVAYAKAPTGYTFDQWESSWFLSSPTSNPTLVTFTGPGWIKAVFTPVECTVNFYTDPVGPTFNITYEGDIYFDGDSDTFLYGTSGLATANVPDGWVFDHWEATGNVELSSTTTNPTTVTVVCGGTLKALFTQTQCPVDFYTDPVGPTFNITYEGDIYFDGDSDTFLYGTSGLATANVPDGWVFDHWEIVGNVEVSSATDNSTTVTIKCGGTLKAVFSPIVSEGWACDVNIRSASLSDQVVFGEWSDASDGVDLYDIINPPSPPPPYLDAYFYNGSLSYPYNRMMEDYRHYPDTYKEWILHVRYEDSTAITVSLSWDNASLISGVAGEYFSVVLIDLDTGASTDMLKYNRYPYSQDPGTAHHFKIITSSAECQVTFYTNPTDVGSITFNDQTYTNGQTGTFANNTSSSATANAPTSWVFDHWESTDNVEVSNSTENPTTVTIKCGGTLKAVFYAMPDLVITDVQMPYSDPILYESIDYKIGVTVANIGPGSAESFNVSLELYWVKGSLTDYHSEITVPRLASGETATVYFQAHTNHISDYILTATADCNDDVAESSETNNSLVINIHSRLAGDIDGDRDVDYMDLYRLAKAYGSKRGDPNYDPEADINCDGKVDYNDLYILARRYGQEDP